LTANVSFCDKGKEKFCFTTSLIPAFQNIHIIYKIYDSLFYKGTIAMQASAQSSTYFVTNPPPNPRKEKNLKIAFCRLGIWDK
jgi:hypothetical protein